MTQEEKDLLLVDLCSRLPYHCRIFYEYVDDLDNKIYGYNKTYGYNLTLNTRCIDEFNADNVVVKPYLRPMSSMTEEERKEVNNLIKDNRPIPYGKINNKGVDNLLSSVAVTSSILIDWLNAHHFDYRDLIGKGLALEAPDGMYNLNK